MDDLEGGGTSIARSAEVLELVGLGVLIGHCCNQKDDWSWRAEFAREVVLADVQLLDYCSFLIGKVDQEHTTGRQVDYNDIFLN